jgi:hypothetical protein
MWILVTWLMLAIGTGAALDSNPGWLKVILSTRTPIVPYGTAVPFKIELINTTKHDIDCGEDWVDSINLTYPYEIVDANGKRIPLRDLGVENDSVRGCTLHPGESKAWEQGLDPRDYPKLKPGQYTVRVSAANPDNPHSSRVYLNSVILIVQQEKQTRISRAEGLWLFTKTQRK